ncbi:MAG: hypothetical protein WAM58_04780 [Candidatus Acidiferrum sp.]
MQEKKKAGELTRVEVWMRGMFAAGISGASGGMMTGLAAVGIDPAHFNLQAGVGATGKIAGAAAMINAVIGVAAYLQKSPLPEREKVEEREEERRI